jgi:aspartyl-tRNA(Asn)/glutamyl-tRNA(Gln) amidotransferase subunit B
VNLSVRRRGDEALGTRVEIKNLNSFAFIVKAIDYEFFRQVSLIEAGEAVLQETRRYDEATGRTERMRGKESAEDYRYFPEPDLPPLVVDEGWIAEIEQALPRLPDRRMAEYGERYGISPSDGEVLTADRAMADFFEEAAACAKHPKRVASLMLSELARLSEGEGFACPISPAHVAELADLWGEDEVNSSTAKALVAELWREDQSPAELVRARGLGQIHDRDTLAAVVAQVIAENPRAVSDYKNGKKAAAKVIVGRVMSQTSGRANPVLTNDLVVEALDGSF